MYLFLRDPCQMCPGERKIQSTYPNVAGQVNTVCAKHAHAVGTYFHKPRGGVETAPKLSLTLSA